MGTITRANQIDWSNLKPKIRKHWGKITEDDLNKLNENMNVLVDVLRKRYGYGKAQAEIEISHWLVKQGLK